MDSSAHRDFHRSGDAQLEVLSEIPSGPARPVPILFVHGGWHGAWCWADHFLPTFAQHGYLSVALSLRGHGGSSGTDMLQQLGVDDFVEDVKSVARELEARTGRHPILVGHSMGGFVVQRCLEELPAPAAVLLASVPPRGLVKIQRQYFLRHPVIAVVGTLKKDPWMLVGTSRLAQDAFLSPSTPEEEQQAFHARLQSESYKALQDLKHGPLPDPSRIKMPIKIIGAELDNTIPRAEIESTGKAYGTEIHIMPDMAHDLMLEPGWDKVADLILTWLESLGL